MSDAVRRYDIDWLRVIAIGLLIIYHIGIGFQSWGYLSVLFKMTNPWIHYGYLCLC